jgi:predicted aspartyl protease
MKHINRFILFLGILVCSNSCNTDSHIAYTKIYTLIEQDNFFKAKEIYLKDKANLTKPYQQFTEAVLDNAFNQLEKSDKKINILINLKNSVPDSLQVKLYEIKYDNAVKRYYYKEAKNAIQTVLSDYKKYLKEEEISDFENSLKIWTALENIPPLKVDIQDKTTIKMKKDIAGLNTLKISVEGDSADFIFDTGANLSTTTQSVAKQLKMNIIPIHIEVGTITGSKVVAQLAVCDKLTLGNIDIYNVIFLVLPDEALSFPQIKYQIYGILGFPVIEALKEIRITQDGYFIVPQNKSTFLKSSNMAISGLTPLIYINNKHFTFDTGADHTLFYHNLYLENKDKIDKKHQSQQISFGGAGGKKEFDGYKIDYTFKIGEKEVKIKNANLLKEKVKDDEIGYGNIGQDLIQKFDTLILNFDEMFIKFE